MEGSFSNSFSLLCQFLLLSWFRAKIFLIPAALQIQAIENIRQPLRNFEVAQVHCSSPIGLAARRNPPSPLSLLVSNFGCFLAVSTCHGGRSIVPNTLTALITWMETQLCLETKMALLETKMALGCNLACEDPVSCGDSRWGCPVSSGLSSRKVLVCVVRMYRLVSM